MQVKDLLVTGNVRVLGNLYTKDGPVGGGSAGGGGGGGDSITYRLTKSGSTITLTGSDGSSSSVTDADTNTTYTLSSLGAAAASHTHTKSQITDFPSSMTPTAHTHTKSQITDFPTSMTPTAHTHAWGEITGKPSTFSPSSHNHSASEITSGTLAVARGGTGQTSIDGIKNALGITNLVASGCLIQEGTYVGTGYYGTAYPTTLSFSFKPKIIFIARLTESYDYTTTSYLGQQLVLVQGQSYASARYFIRNSYTEGTVSENSYPQSVTWSGNSVSWCYLSYQGGSSSASDLQQMNGTSKTYRYIAIG